AVDAMGNVAVAGTYQPPLTSPPSSDAGPQGPDLGCGSLALAQGTFVAIFDKGGTCKGSTSFPAAPSGASLALLSDGTLVMAGGITGTGPNDFGCASKPSGSGAFVTRFDGTAK